jgi:hypothetical protein
VKRIIAVAHFDDAILVPVVASGCNYITALQAPKKEKNLLCEWFCEKNIAEFSLSLCGEVSLYLLPACTGQLRVLKIELQQANRTYMLQFVIIYEDTQQT